MLDPVSAIAFEVQASKGVFALLLGSGVSFTAKIPTGWDITLDLVKQVAALRKEDCGSHPEIWYYDTFRKQPDYSDLLDELATTPAVRQQIIKKYIEPSDDERKRGEKQPTAAHRAIAQLMASGHIRVVITTNFDQLLEQALAELNINPTVISSADQVAGAPPLAHAEMIILKLHGDYLDTRIRNTAGELASYEPAIDTFLDRVLDEFGLIVCGWSGEWDVALKAAIDRTPSRRYPMYWASFNEPKPAAQALIKRRSARVISISGADNFFDDLIQKVRVIENLQKPHPFSTEMAVAMLKEYLVEPSHRIRLHDLVASELDAVLSYLDSSGFSTDFSSKEIFAKQTKQYISALSTLLPMAYTAGLWCTPEQAHQWVDVVKHFARRMRGVTGQSDLVELRAFPATLLIYAFCLGAVINRRPSLVGMMMGTVMDFDSSTSMALGDRLNIATLLANSGGAARFKAIEPYDKARLPGSALLADLLKPISKYELRDDQAFTTAFAKVELTISFGFLERHGKDHGDEWTPPGLYGFTSSTKSILADWKIDYETNGSQSDVAVMAHLVSAPQFEQMVRLMSKMNSLIW